MPGAEAGRKQPLRTLAVCCEGFAALASGRGTAVPLAVLSGNRVVSVTPGARLEGVRPGMRKREAESMCPMLELVAADPERDARAFEKVMAALEQLAPRWEVTSPGRCSVPSRGPARFFGGEAAVAGKVLEAVRSAIGGLARKNPTGPASHPPAVGVSVVDGPWAAAVLAERAARAAGSVPSHLLRGAPGSSTGNPGGTPIVVVPPGAAARHLGGLPTAALMQGGGSWGPAEDREHLVEVLERLGLHTLGRYANLEPSDVLSRFGRLGLRAHDMARGAESSLLCPSERPGDLEVSTVFDPPATTVEQVAFMARSSAVQMQAGLAERGLVCTRVLVSVRTAGGDRIDRLWRDEGALDPSGVAQRTRWQLEGWVTRNAASRECPPGTDGDPADRDGAAPDPGVASLLLRADQAIPHQGDQLGLWSRPGKTPERVEKGVARLDAMLGPGRVTVPRLGGGRSPAERHDKRPFGVEGPDGGEPAAPWPGAPPSPQPTLVWRDPQPLGLFDREGAPVAVNGRGLVSAPPAVCTDLSGRPEEVLSWAGPWCIDERWWDPLGQRRRARIQVLLGSGAHLVTLEHGQWRLEATYD